LSVSPPVVDLAGAPIGEDLEIPLRIFASQDIGVEALRVELDPVPEFSMGARLLRRSAQGPTLTRRLSFVRWSPGRYGRDSSSPVSSTP
jgi:hypothetical protein